MRDNCRVWRPRRRRQVGILKSRIPLSHVTARKISGDVERWSTPQCLTSHTLARQPAGFRVVVLRNAGAVPVGATAIAAEDQLRSCDER